MIAGENKPAEYCFDEAWISHLENSGILEDSFPEINDILIETKVLEEGYTILACFPGINKALLEIVNEYSSTAVACAAFEISKRNKSIPDELDGWLEYASDKGDVQRNMYGRLTDEVDTCKTCKKDESECGKHSKDLMTNFGYTFRIIFRLIENLDTLEIVKLGETAYSGRTKPVNASLCSSGFCSFKNLLSGLSRNEKSCLLKNLGRFARCSSMLGNFCCIPSRLTLVNISSLNIAKGNCRKGLYVFADGKKYPVNDQFALFVEWLDENAAEEDQKTIERWKEKMLLEKTWDAYKEAASAYKNIFKRSTRAGRIGAICDYLFQVSEAIENRSPEIVEKLKPQDK